MSQKAKSVISSIDEQNGLNASLKKFNPVYKETLDDDNISRIEGYLGELRDLLVKNLEFVDEDRVTLDLRDVEDMAIITEITKNPILYMEAINRLCQYAKININEFFVEIIADDSVENVSSKMNKKALNGLVSLEDVYMEHIGSERSNPLKQAFICQDKHVSYRKFRRGEEIEKPLQCVKEDCNYNPYKQIKDGQNIGNGESRDAPHNHDIQIKQVVINMQQEHTEKDQRKLGEVDKGLFDKVERGKEYDLTAIVRKEKDSDVRAEEYYLHIIGVEKKDKQSNISDEEKEQVNSYVRDTTLEERVKDIDTYTDDRYYPRLAALLSVVKGKENAESVNGNIHTLVVGKTGYGKSELCERAVNLASPGGMVDVQKASKAGLVGSAEKMELMGEGQTWVLTHGELARHSGGSLLIDEMDKANGPELINVLSQTMENQETTKTKAGKKKTLETDVSILGTCNPVKDWQKKKRKLDTIGEEIQPHILNRFDLIIWYSEEEGRKSHEEEKQELVSMLDDDKTRPDIYPQYVQMARNMDPDIIAQSSEEFEASDKLVECIQDAKKKGNSNRVRETLVNLSVGIAKLKLKDTVELKEVEEAWELFKNSEEEIYNVEYSS
jgi:DNA replicative helicase MCM subunit Mcm2 (Cdc46/Mcm family)